MLIAKINLYVWSSRLIDVFSNSAFKQQILLNSSNSTVAITMFKLANLWITHSCQHGGGQSHSRLAVCVEMSPTSPRSADVAGALRFFASAQKNHHVDR
jgi:hypothetical protein